MADERFPIQDGPSVPWAFMAPHEARARRNHGQTLEGLAKRGGLGCAEAWVIVHGLRHADIQEEEHKRKWIELAERVNREWSVQQARAEVLAACAAEILKRAGELRDLLKTIEESCGPGDVDAETERLRMENRAEELELVAAGIRSLQPAAKDLEGFEKRVQQESYGAARILWTAGICDLLKIPNPRSDESGLEWLLREGSRALEELLRPGQELATAVMGADQGDLEQADRANKLARAIEEKP